MAVNNIRNFFAGRGPAVAVHVAIAQGAARPARGGEAGERAGRPPVPQAGAAEPLHDDAMDIDEGDPAPAPGREAEGEVVQEAEQAEARVPNPPHADPAPLAPGTSFLLNYR